MRIILAAALALAMPLPRAEANLRGDSEPFGEGVRSLGVLEDCQIKCRQDMCVDMAEEATSRAAETVASGKRQWCMKQNGKFTDWSKKQLCGENLKEKPKYDCEEYSLCVEDNVCTMYRNACGESQIMEEREWAFKMCESQQYKELERWYGPRCPMEDYLYEEKEEYNCSDFQDCVRRNHCDQYSDQFSNFWCTDSQSRDKARWARMECDARRFNNANKWKKKCEIAKFRVENKEFEAKVCDAYHDCMFDNQFNRIAGEDDALVEDCIANDDEVKEECKDECIDCRDCLPEDMKSCANKFEECEGKSNEKKRSKKRSKCYEEFSSRGYAECCCSDKDLCKHPGDGWDYCPFFDEWNGNRVDIDFCRSNPCRNGGTCWNKSLGYYCTCPPRYVGDNCEAKPPPDPCDEAFNPCDKGKCINEGRGEYVCKCREGWEGKNCDSMASACRNNSCENGSMCIDKGNGKYTCKCRDGYSGDRCEKDCVKCEDKSTTWMDKKGISCNSWDWGVKKGHRCSKDNGANIYYDVWNTNRYCEHSCFVAGYSYPDRHPCCVDDD